MFRTHKRVVSPWSGLFLVLLCSGWACGQFIAKLSEEDQKLINIQHNSEVEISVRKVNQFHLLLLDKWIRGSSSSLALEYDGIVCDGGRPRNLTPDLGIVTIQDRWIEGSYGTPLGWRLVDKDDELLFGFWISTKKTTKSIGRIRIDSETIHVNLDYTMDDVGIEAPIKQLNGRTIRDLLRQLENDVE